ncbi:MAG: MurT ligase domain-containing protein [Candidatus Dojkabacteria bacterium]|nr:MurT ligase domain-containing protein [Candidatus Dojkabacteria bacterium]
MFFLYVIRSVVFILRKFKITSSTAFPGLLVEKYFPHLVPVLLNKLKDVIVITGTNGKTTVASAIHYILENSGKKCFINASGSNMLRGILSHIIINLDNKLNLEHDYSILELEEATFPKLVKYIKPKLVIVTNIFRDQLDAYGEIDKTFAYIKDGIENSNNPTVILNASDQRLVHLYKCSNRVISVSVSEEVKKYLFLERYYEKPQELDIHPDVFIHNIEQKDIDHTLITFEYKNEKYDLETSILGLHNAINLIFAWLAVVHLLGFNDTDNKRFLDILGDFKPAFGRGEKINISNTEFILMLVKNPAGMNMNLYSLSDIISANDAILFILNDNIADGRDVSWIWDCDFNIVNRFQNNVILVSGIRKDDIALRISYEVKDKEIKVFDDYEKIFDHIMQKEYKRVFVLPTYTAMLSVRKFLYSKLGIKQNL